MTDAFPETPEPEPQPEPAHAPTFDELTLTSEPDDDGHVIRLFGELDIASAEMLERELERVEATDAPRIVVDLSGLTFMDSTGIRLLLTTHKRQQDGADRLRLRRGPDSVHRVFELSGVVEILPFAD
ncbi:MAG TPA: STAS domain-containing protein [Solirubrobacteraceae bacterium]|nr:STAS domain-containing protein [Solirubrobacteraceae bacterium]